MSTRSSTPAAFRRPGHRRHPWNGRPDDRCSARSIRHRPSPVGCLQADPRRRVLSAPPKAGSRCRRDDTSDISTTATLLTDATSTVISDSPTLESTERRSLHNDGRVVPPAWWATNVQAAPRLELGDVVIARKRNEDPSEARRTPDRSAVACQANQTRGLPTTAR